MLKRVFYLLFFLIQLLCITSFAQHPQILSHGGPIQVIEYSPTNPLVIASGGDNHYIKLWNLEDQSYTTLTGHTDKINTLAFSKDGEFLLTASNDRTLKLWDVQEKEFILTLIHKERGNSASTVTSVAFSPDGLMFATAGHQSVILWEVKGWVDRKTLKHDNWVNALAFSSDGRLLTTVDGKFVKVWDLNNHKVITSFEFDHEWLSAIIFSPDSQILAMAGSDGIIKLISVSDWNVIRVIKDVSSISALKFSPDGKRIVSAGSDVVVWSVDNGRKLSTYPEHTGWVIDASFSPDGNSIASGGMEDGQLFIRKIKSK